MAPSLPAQTYFKGKIKKEKIEWTVLGGLSKGKKCMNNSQNHRMFEVGRDLWRPSGATPA